MYKSEHFMIEQHQENSNNEQTVTNAKMASTSRNITDNSDSAELLNKCERCQMRHASDSGEHQETCVKFNKSHGNGKSPKYKKVIKIFYNTLSTIANKS